MTSVVVLYLCPIKFNISTRNGVTNILPKTGPPRGGQGGQLAPDPQPQGTPNLRNSPARSN